jgi:hypothetical protein
MIISDNHGKTKSMRRSRAMARRTVRLMDMICDLLSSQPSAAVTSHTSHSAASKKLYIATRGLNVKLYQERGVIKISPIHVDSFFCSLHLRLCVAGDCHITHYITKIHQHRKYKTIKAAEKFNQHTYMLQTVIDSNDIETLKVYFTERDDFDSPEPQDFEQ